MTNLKYNEYLDSNYLSTDFYTEEEMEMLEKYYKDTIQNEDDLPF